MSGLGCECLVGRSSECTGELGGRMDGVREWLGWENEWARLHMLQIGRE